MGRRRQANGQRREYGGRGMNQNQRKMLEEQLGMDTSGKPTTPQPGQPKRKRKRMYFER